MPRATRASRPTDRRDPVVAGVIRRWRELTTPPRSRRAGPGEPLLVACSGGADSCALVLMLAAASDTGIVAHIMHDLRPKREALADRDAAKRLAALVGWRFVQASVKVRALAGNAEANARRVRYAALAKLARRCGVRFIATGHHGDDQIETVLMRLMRGSGPTRLAGIRERRALPGLPRVQVIRPMLALSAADARRVCRAAGWKWQEDRTNADVSLLRNCLRAEVLPRLRKMRPDLPERVGVLAAQSEALEKMLARAAARLLKQATSHSATADLRSESGGTRKAASGRGKSHALTWNRAWLARRPVAVVGEAVRAAALRVSGGAARDHLPWRTVDAITRAVRDGDGTVREWMLHGARIVIDAKTVRVEAVKKAGQGRRVAASRAS